MRIMARSLQENEIGQIFTVDVEMKVDLSVAGTSDRVEDTVHYGEVYEDIKAIMHGSAVQLIEHLAERIALRINSHYNRVMETKVRITKKIHLYLVIIKGSV